MKKLMIAAAIVCAAALSQAATVNWGISSVKADGGADPTAGWSVMAFYTEKGAGSDAIVAAINGKTAASLAFDEQELKVNMHKGKFGPADATVPGITDTSKNYDFYFVVFNDADATKATQYVMDSALNVEYTGTATKYTPSVDFSVHGNGWNNIATGTPEPTSGMLLLLGVAGLALRRRRA